MPVERLPGHILYHVQRVLQPDGMIIGRTAHACTDHCALIIERQGVRFGPAAVYTYNNHRSILTRTAAGTDGWRPECHRAARQQCPTMEPVGEPSARGGPSPDPP